MSEPTPEAASQAALLSEATMVMNGADSFPGKKAALQQLVDDGRLIFRSDRGRNVPGVDNAIETPPLPGETLGRILLKTTANYGGGHDLSITTFGYDMNGRPVEVVRASRANSGAYLVSEKTTFKYHPNGQVAREERRHQAEGKWVTDIRTFDDQGRPLK